MKYQAVTPVILCGGSGTRLWPLSRKSFPKQFVSLIGNKSLFQLSLERVCELNCKVIVVSAEDYRFMVVDAFQETLRMEGEIILEPVARNTAAAMALAALHTMQVNDDILLFCPADHYIPDKVAFAKTIEQGFLAAQLGSIVTFGVMPYFPSTAYGYIQQGAGIANGNYQVERFVEKPDVTTAQQLVLTGNVLWNAGIFLCKASTLLAAFERHAPDILSVCYEAMAKVKSELSFNGYKFIRPDVASFLNCRSQSIDHAVMEKHDNLVVVPFNGQWSDVGSWSAVVDFIDSDGEGNRIHGQGIVCQSRDTFIHALHRPVVALGTESLCIIDTPDALLVAHKDYAEQVKDVVVKLEKAQYVQAINHRKVARPWGWYDSIGVGDGFQVKRIGVKPGASLSLQKHQQRAEHWVVVKGMAEIICGDETFVLHENQSTYIPIGAIHSLKNIGTVELEIVEIQSGSYLGEDDIIRLQDTYGRAI